ncbi:MAG TPA: hypothetical protein VHN37_15040 [Actinomycetota bacterium]|nr:hypothetical protein [Actinomycetota bacterium]
MRAFALVAVLATALGAAFFATRDASPSEPPRGPVRSPDYSLTDAEAIARFSELHDLFRTASMSRDVSLLGVMLTGNSPLHAPARRQIQQLIRDRVIDRSKFEDVHVAVTANTPTRLEIEQVVMVHPVFRTEDTGRLVSAGPPLRQRVAWVLALEDSVWKVHDSEVLSSRRVR